jgi:hypothetical protein
MLTKPIKNLQEKIKNLFLVTTKASLTPVSVGVEAVQGLPRQDFNGLKCMSGHYFWQVEPSKPILTFSLIGIGNAHDKATFQAAREKEGQCAMQHG